MSETDEALEHLKWMLQKDVLNQDMMLIGYVGVKHATFFSSTPHRFFRINDVFLPLRLCTPVIHSYNRPPGIYRRLLAYLFCEITQREVEYICITQDTADSDLKQASFLRGSLHS